MPSVSLLTIVLFFVYMWGFGFALTRLVRESGSFLERNLMRVGFGLSALILLGIIFNALRIPLDYRIFLVASLAVPLYYLIFKKGYMNFPKPSLKLTASSLSIFALLGIFLLSLFMYESGAFRYPYLEDDDPWGHASAAMYVSVEKTTYDSPYLNFQYMDPYPPGYDMMFGILKQSSGSIYWVVKFFNALIISLSLLFFYFFVKEFTGSRNRALFATFVLASVPAYLSHFIWAPALAIALFFQAMYAFEMIKRDKRWWIVAAVCLAAILLAHPTHAAKLSAMILIYLGIKAFSDFVTDRKSWLRQNISHFAAVAGGVGLSLFWWGFKLRAFSGLTGGAWASSEAVTAIKSSGNIFTKLLTLLTRILYNSSGTATRAYSFQDFVVTHSANMVNNPIGFGVAASLLVFAGLAGVILRFAAAVPKRRLSVPFVLLLCFAVTMIPLGLNPLQIVLAIILSAFVLSLLAILGDKGSAENKHNLFWLSVTLGWLLFTFLGVNSVTFNLPVGLFAFRFWMILAIPVAIIAAEGFFALLGAVSMFRLDKAAATTAKAILIAIVVAGIFFTSARQKYDVNTACWPAGAFWGGSLVGEPSSGCPVPSEVVAYEWLRTLPTNTKVFTFSNPDQVLAYGAYSCGWCSAEHGMKQRFSNVTAPELYDFMKSNSYEYVVIGGIEARGFGLNQTLRLINDVAASRLFSVASQGEAAIFFRTV